MVKQLSSSDIHFLVRELKELEGSRVDKIYNLGKEELYLQLYKSNEGKKLLRIIYGKALFIASKKKTEDIPSEFCMMLRKHLDGKTLHLVEQMQPERIVKLTFRSKDEERFLYIEQFGKGNVILCDGNTILDSSFRQRFKDRSILPKKEYVYPSMKYDLFSVDKKQLAFLLESSRKDKVITSLATELGLGGVYSEETCLLSKIDKKTPPNKIKSKEVQLILDSLQSILRKHIKALIVYDSDTPVDITPFSFEHYSEMKLKEFDSFSKALEHYFTQEISLDDQITSPYENQIGRLQRIIAEQEETIKTFEKKESDLKQKGEKIYEEYALVSEILNEILKASATHSWKDIQKKLKGHKIIKEVDVKDKKIVLEL